MSRIAIAAEKIAEIRELVERECPDDMDLLAGMMEGETDLHSLCAWAVWKIESENGVISALKEQIDNRIARKKRAENRAKSMRTLLQGLIATSGLNKVEIPEATISRRVIPPKRVVTDLDALPDRFATFKKSANLKAIKEADEMPTGVTMDNGGESLTVRMK